MNKIIIETEHGNISLCINDNYFFCDNAEVISKSGCFDVLKLEIILVNTELTFNTIPEQPEQSQKPIDNLDNLKANLIYTAEENNILKSDNNADNKGAGANE